MNEEEHQSFSGDLGFYRPVSTADGSVTFYSEHYQEAFHNLDGAEGETFYNFVEGCDIVARARQYPPSILEVGLGMGRGYQATMKALENNFVGSLTFVSVERDTALIDWCKNNVTLPSYFPNYCDLKQMSAGTFSWWEAKDERIRLLVLPGDATETLLRAGDLGTLPSFNSIYQDAFSPGKNPELWTVEWFSLLKRLSSSEILLSTYSSSAGVKKNLEESGFSVRKRQGFGRKKSSFWAFLKESAK